MNLPSRPRTIRRCQFPGRGTVTIPLRRIGDEFRKYDDFTLNADASLLEEKSERIARVEIETLKLDLAASLAEKGCGDIDRAAARLRTRIRALLHDVVGAQ